MKEPQLTKLEKLLRAAPSTTAECATLLGIPRREVQIGMQQLKWVGRVRVVGSVANTDEPRRGAMRTLKLYSA